MTVFKRGKDAGARPGWINSVGEPRGERRRHSVRIDDALRRHPGVRLVHERATLIPPYQLAEPPLGDSQEQLHVAGFEPRERRAQRPHRGRLVSAPRGDPGPEERRGRGAIGRALRSDGSRIPLRSRKQRRRARVRRAARPDATARASLASGGPRRLDPASG